MKKEYVLSKQLLRSGTSIRANVREAINAESKADLFINYLLLKKSVMNLYIRLNIENNRISQRGGF